jgi:hypothetical protein
MARKSKTGQVSDIWFCGTCNRAHTDKSDAIECCVNPPKRGYACDECDGAYDDEDDAKNCCLPECAKCEEKFDPSESGNETLCQYCAPVAGREADERFERETDR